MSANNILLQRAVPALLELAKAQQIKDYMFVGLENQNEFPLEKELKVSLYGAIYSATPLPIDYFENSSLLHLGNDREEVSLSMDVLQTIFGPASKLQAFAVNNSEVIVLMVDKVYNDVTPHENLMQCIATVLSEMYDMETGKIAEIARIRLPLVISGGFTMAARHEGEDIRIDLYNEDLIHTGSIEGLRLQF